MRTAFFDFNMDDLQAINIYPILHPDKRTTLVKRKDKWYIDLGSGIFAQPDSVYVQRSLIELRKMKPSNLAAINQDQWPEFGVDSLGTLLELQTPDKLFHRIIIGNLGFVNERQVCTYLRLPNENETYAADNYMEGTFKADPDQWRYGILAEGNKSMWQHLRFSGLSDQLIDLELKDSKWMIGDQEFDHNNADSLLDLISGLNAHHAYAPTSIYPLLRKPDFMLSLFGQEQQELNTISFFELNQAWYARSSKNEGNIFIIPENVVETVKRIMGSKNM